MQTFKAYLTEMDIRTAKPSQKLSQSAFVRGLEYYWSPIPEPDDIDHTVELIPIKKIVTRERGTRQSLTALVRDYQTRPALIPPPVVDKRYDGKFLVIDGHHRLKAAKNAGLTDIWVVVLGHRHDRGSRTLCTCGHDRRTHDGSLIFDDEFGRCNRCKCPRFTPVKR